MVPVSELSYYFYCYELLRGMARLSKVAEDNGKIMGIAVKCNLARQDPPFRDSALEFYATNDEKISGKKSSGAQVPLLSQPPLL